MGTCCGAAQFLSHLSRAIEKPNLGSKNPTQKSCHGSILHAELPSNKQQIISRDKEIIFRGINYTGFKGFIILPAPAAGVKSQPCATSPSPLLHAGESSTLCSLPRLQVLCCALLGLFHGRWFAENSRVRRRWGKGCILAALFAKENVTYPV